MARSSYSRVTLAALVIAGVHDELLEAFRTTLGGERHGYFRGLSGDEIA
jgi:hypothetical protein